MKRVQVQREDGSSLCTAEVATSMWSRMRGLLGRRSLDEGAGLLIDPCSSIHMFFMRFPIDVVYLNKEDVVVKHATVPIWRMSAGGRAIAASSGCGSASRGLRTRETPRPARKT